MKKTADVEGRNPIGRRLREIRLKQTPGVTLEDMTGRLAARVVLLDRSAIGRIENLTRYVLDYELKALAEALKVTPGDLVLNLIADNASMGTSIPHRSTSQFCGLAGPCLYLGGPMAHE